MSNPASAAAKARGAKAHRKADLGPGDMVFLKSNGNKHTARDPFLVTANNDSKVAFQKVLHSSNQHEDAPRINLQKLKTEEKFL